MSIIFDPREIELGKGAVFQRTLPLLGHIAKGEKKKINANKPGSDIKNGGLRLSIRTRESLVYPIVKDFFGIKNINSDFITGGVPISLAFEDVFDNVWVGRRETMNSKGQVKHDCQDIPYNIRKLCKSNVPKNAKSVVLYRVSFQDKKKITETLYAPPDKTRIVFCDGKKCKPVILFRFHIRVGGLENHGVFGFSTSSIYDIQKIPRQLLYYDKLLREYGFPHGIRHVPLILERLDENVTTTAPKVGTFKSEKWLVNIRLDGEFLKMCPIFSTPPLQSFGTQKTIIRARIDDALKDLLVEYSKDIRLPDEAIEYIKAILETGVYEKKNMLYPVTSDWVERVLIPRIQRTIDDVIDVSSGSNEETERDEDNVDIERESDIEDTDKDTNDKDEGEDEKQVNDTDDSVSEDVDSIEHTEDDVE